MFSFTTFFYPCKTRFLTLCAPLILTLPTLPATAQNRFSPPINLRTPKPSKPVNTDSQTPTLPLATSFELSQPEEQLIPEENEPSPLTWADSSTAALLYSEQDRLSTLSKCASEESFFQKLQHIPATSVCWRLLPFQNPISPALSLRLSSSFGFRFHPVTKKWTLHKGIDIAASQGTSVYAAGAGLVTAAGYDRLLGNFVRVNHGFGWSSIYGHLSSIAVQKGAKLVPTQLIGHSGTTGRSTGPHLHFGVYYNRKPVDGLRFLNLLRKGGLKK